MCSFSWKNWYELEELVLDIIRKPKGVFLGTSDRSLKGGFNLLAASTIVLAAFTLPAKSLLAAERVFLTYSIFGRSVSIQALERFVEDGTLTADMVSYARFLKPTQRKQLREGLQQNIKFSHISVSKFLYAPTGELLLRRISQVIRAKTPRSSFFALRAALIQAAQDPKGITPLTVMRHYPDKEIVVDLNSALTVVRQVERLFRETTQISDTILSESQSSVAALPPDLQTQLRQWENPGGTTFTKITLSLRDGTPQRLQLTRRAREFPVDYYLPEVSNPAPVVVISHGLNSDRQSYAYLAEHLASYGFAVAVPEHPGSNKRQIQSLLEARARDVAEPTEFVDRPLDIQFLLDELQTRTQIDPRFQGKANPQQAAIIGQSFGGYTSLVVAGALISPGGLRQQCGRDLLTTLNASLLLQCQALQLPVLPRSLKDPRIQGAIAINPITSGILGQKGLAALKVPIMFLAGNLDIIAPAIAEQFQPFTWLTTEQRYLGLIRNSDHFSTIMPTQDDPLSLPRGLELDGAPPDPNQARSYLKAISIAFMRSYLSKVDQDDRALKGIPVLSRGTMPIGVVRTLSMPEPPPKKS
jgi:predicted dienelactone hydrolase